MAEGESEHPGHTVLPSVLDEFDIAATDGIGTQACIVTTLCGQNITVFSLPQRVSLPWDVLKQTAFTVLLGLDFLHSVKGVVHGGGQVLSFLMQSVFLIFHLIQISKRTTFFLVFLMIQRLASNPFSRNSIPYTRIKDLLRLPSTAWMCSIFAW